MVEKRVVCVVELKGDPVAFARMVDMDKSEFFGISSVIIKLPISGVSRKQASVTKTVSIAFEACSEVQHGQTRTKTLKSKQRC